MYTRAWRMPFTLASCGCRDRRRFPVPLRPPVQCHPEFLKSGSTQTDCQSNASVSRVNFKFNAFSSESPNDTGER